MTFHFVLVPGHWLGAWAWERVASALRADGHDATAVTLPGLESAGADRSTIGLDDQVSALTTLLAEIGAAAVLVAHSGAGKIVSGVLDRSPDAVQRVIYVDSGPSADGDSTDLPVDLLELELPSWEEFRANGASLEGLSDADLKAFRARAVPEPAAVVRDRLRVQNPARREVPSTVIACSIPSPQVRQLAASGHPMFAELAHVSDVTYLDLPTGHWPMWSKPVELATLLVQVAMRQSVRPG